MDSIVPLATLKTKQKHSWQFDAIGTYWSIETTRVLPGDVRQAIKKHIDVFDMAYSRFRDDSVVAAMEQAPDAFLFPGSAQQLGDLYKNLYDATNGALSPLVGSSLVAAGYDKDYSFNAVEPQPAPKWEDVMTWQGISIKTNWPVKLDVGAAGKGLLVDELAEILNQAGYDSYTVDASGDVKVRGEVQRIGLENPFDAETVIGIIDIANESLCASATNRRKWGDGWHHVLDARTGRPVEDVIATWVITESTMIADGLATALFFVPGSNLQSIAPFDYVRLFADGKVEHSKRFVGQLFT